MLLTHVCYQGKHAQNQQNQVPFITRELMPALPPHFCTPLYVPWAQEELVLCWPTPGSTALLHGL